MKQGAGIVLKGKIIPVEVNLFYRNGQPFLYYVGEVESNLGKIKIHIPEVGLEFNKIELEQDEDYVGGFGERKLLMFFSHQAAFLSSGEWFEYEILEREMTHAELKQSLGYKIKIVDNK